MLIILVMVNLLALFDGATGCPDIWSDIILSVTVGMFLAEIEV